MEFRRTIKEVIQKYQYWRAPRCEECGTKLIDVGKSKILYEGSILMAPAWRFEISITEKGSLRFKETALGAGTGITWTIRDSSWCRQDASVVWSLIKPEMIYRRKV